jgi:type I restriction enzyme S subunit
MADNQEYQLVTVKRRHEGVVPRSVLFGREILVKSQFMVERGDFVISKRQIVHGACGVVPDSLHGSIVSNEYCVLNSKSMLDMDYFCWATRTPLMMKYFMMSSIGVHIEKMLFKLRDWLRFSIPVPPLEEQKDIAAILNAAEVPEVEYGARLECLRGVKRGLMQDLLSGDVRVCA